jgi:hypothetical protein
MVRLLGIILSLTAYMLLSAIPALAGQDDDAPVRYVVRKGDTLIQLGETYLIRADHYKIVQRQNRIADPLAMPVGKVLIIGRNLLKYRPAKARLVAVRGQVLAGQAQVSVGQSLDEGTQISTAASSFASLQLDDGSRISLPSNTQIRIRRLRSYVLGGSLDYDFDVIKGGIGSTVVKHKSGDDRYQVRTPKAVSAVRGTDFQSRYDVDAGTDFAEVVDGTLAVGAGTAAPSPLAAGNGLAVVPGGQIIREALLPEPSLIEPGRIQADPLVAFVADRLAGAKGYRLTLAADAGFIDQIADVAAAGEQLSFANIPNGNYFVRARAISANGIEGIPATFAFKRRLNGITASAGPADDGYVFKWTGEGEGTRRHHFQLFRGNLQTLPMVDEAALDGDRILLSDLPPGEYYWRVGAVQYLDNEMTTNWSPLEKLIITPS